MTGWIKIVVGGLIAVSTLVVLTVGIRRFVEQRRLSDEIDRLRDDLYRARVSADRCRNSLSGSEASLHALTETIDSLRSRVDSFEALGGGNVPADRYDDYLAVFDAYNDSVASWEVRSERLLGAEASCRAVIDEHNALSDSIQSVLEGAGLID
jgi:hypothetical protein